MKTPVTLLFLMYLTLPGKCSESGSIHLNDTSAITEFIKKGHDLINFAPDSSIAFAKKAIQLSLLNNRYKLAEAKRLKMIAHYYRGETRQCVTLLQEILPLLGKSDFKKKGAACNNLGLMYMGLNRGDSAEIYYDSASHYYEKLSEPYIQGMADVLVNKAVLEIERGNPELALDYNFQSLKLLKIEDNPENFAVGYNNIGSLYLQIGNYEKSLKYLQKSLDLKIAGKLHTSISNTYALLGDTYVAMDDYEDAESSYRKALHFDRKMANKPGEGSTLGSLANLYFIQGLHEPALQTALESERIKREFSNENDHAGSQHLLGMIYRAMGSYDEARRALDFAESFFLKTGNLIGLIEVLKEKAVLEENDGNFDMALSLERRAYNARQSLLNEEKVGKIVEMEAKFQNELKEEKIKNLSVQAQLHEALIKKQNLILTLLGAGALILFAAIILMYITIAHRKRLHEQQRINMRKEQELVSLKSMISGEEKERTRIAKDLHDGLSGLLAATKMQFEVVRQESALVANHDTYNAAMQSLAEASREVRRIAHNMVPQLLMRFGLIQALEEYIKNINGIGGVQINFRQSGMDSRLNSETELTLYRIIQELLNNILKHSNATEVLLEINKKENLLFLTVEDNGLGFDMNNTDSEGMGLENLTSRVDFLGGEMNIKTAPEKGTSVFIEITLRKEAVEI